MGIFNSIKKSRRASSDIDEKIEYLDKELEKNGLREAMTTSGIYVATKDVPNSSHNAFKALSHDGQSLAFSGADYNIFTEPLNNLVYSPPHPVTGQRRVAQSYFGIASDFRPVAAGSDRQILWVFDQSLGSDGDWFTMELSRSDPPYWGVWIDTAFGVSILVPYEGESSNLSPSMKDDLNNLNVNNFTNPDDFGPENNTIAFKNDLDDPDFIKINIPGLSGQGYEWLKNKANDTASGVNYDLYNYLDKRFGIEASNWYENNPTKPHESNPYIPPPEAPYVPLANKSGDVKIAAEYKKKKKKYTGANDPFWDAFTDSIPGGTKDFPGKDPDDPFKFSQGHQTSSYDPEGDLLSEAAKLGHFEPEILNVDINDIRKGIMPEFPKDPPPEMVNGYNPNSRLAPKELDPAPYIKITRKDLAQNHKLTDKEITQFMNDIKMVNEYIKKNPADLIYAQTRYPKHDPRLAQLNWQMDQMLDAGKEYMDKTFPENEKLFKKIQKTIKKNIELTDPKSFKDVEIPKFKGVNLTDFKRRKEVVSRHFKKAVKIERLFSNKKRRNSIREEREYLNNESENNTLKEFMSTTGMYFATRENPAIPAVMADVPDSTGVLGSGFTPPIGGNGNANDPSNYPDAYDTAWMYNSNDVDGVTNRPIVKTMDQSVIDAYNVANPENSRFPSGGAGVVFGPRGFGTGVGYASGGHYIGVLTLVWNEWNVFSSDTRTSSCYHVYEWNIHVTRWL